MNLIIFSQTVLFVCVLNCRSVKKSSETNKLSHETPSDCSNTRETSNICTHLISQSITVNCKNQLKEENFSEKVVLKNADHKKSHETNLKNDDNLLKNLINDIPLKFEIIPEIKNIADGTEDLNKLSVCNKSEQVLTSINNSNTYINKDTAVISTSVNIHNSLNNVCQMNIDKVKANTCNIECNTFSNSNKIKYKENSSYSLKLTKGDKEKDEDVEEFLRASEGLNRCNKRLVKNSLNTSDILIIEENILNEERVDDWEELLDDSKFLGSSLFPRVTFTAYTDTLTSITTGCTL